MTPKKPVAMSSVPPAVEESSEEKRKRKRRSYDVAFKMEVIEYAQAHNKTQAAKQYDIHRRCVQTWCKTKDKLEAANSKRMRVADEERSVETVEVSISGITDGEILATLPVTCANVVNDDVTIIDAALTLAVIRTRFFIMILLTDIPYFLFQKTEQPMNPTLLNDWDSTVSCSNGFGRVYTSTRVSFTYVVFLWSCVDGGCSE